MVNNWPSGRNLVWIRKETHRCAWMQHKVIRLLRTQLDLVQLTLLFESVKKLYAFLLQAMPPLCQLARTVNQLTFGSGPAFPRNLVQVCESVWKLCAFFAMGHSHGHASHKHTYTHKSYKYSFALCTFPLGFQVGH